MRPIIGITTSITQDEGVHQMNRCYTEALLAVGAVPVMLPLPSDLSVLPDCLSRLDGLLLSGGDDVDPTHYGETQHWVCGDVTPLRDSFEIALCREAIRHRLPLLGICRGVQVMNVAQGGSLFQDLKSEYPGETLAHQQKQLSRYTSHAVQFSEDSALAAIFGCNALQVNSHHHQAVQKVAPGFTITATAPDGVIEALEYPELPFCIGVQWHPERLVESQKDTLHRRLFEAFADACR